MISEETRKKLSESHKGHKHSEETKRKIGLAHKGGNSGSFKKGCKINLGRKLTTWEKERISKSLKGKKPWNKGIPQSEETKRKLSLFFKGKPNLKNRKEIHKTDESKLWRMKIEYRLWREAVFARDNWTCQHCGKKGEKLHPHHIKSFAKYPELRISINNGLTLCVDCHKKTDTYGVNLNK